jgi:hypothetical protein
MSSPPERRRFTRIRAGFQVELVASDGSRVRGEIRDVSVQGVCLSADTLLSPGTPCRVTLLPQGRAPAPGIEARGTVLRAGDGLLALRFDELPYEAFERLRALLLEAAEDPTALEEEFTERLPAED